MSESALRLAMAGSTLLAYGAMCVAIYRRERHRHRAFAQTAAALKEGDDEPPTLVLFASQTGQAEQIAWQTADWLHALGHPVRVLPLNDASVGTLRSAKTAVFVASTYGEGDAPDGASIFAEHVMCGAPSLGGLRYAVLALGDRQYARFCGFGRALDEWLQSAGATRAFERLEVDNGDPGALAAWQIQWRGEASSGMLASAASEPHSWRLAERQLLNDGSAGSPIYHLAFTPETGAMPDWMSGDIAQIDISSDPGKPRDYSIASIPADGSLQLIVRQEQHPDGTLGAASGFLSSILSIGDTVTLRLRPHRNFRLDGNEARPLILIGNGTGLAGLRSHLRARALTGERANWLVFGERNVQHDFLCREEVESWKSSGILRRLDMAFSRDQPERVYVQHRLLQASEEILQWIRDGAAIYVCGSLLGMASGVDAALRQIAGNDLMRDLTAEGRYRRDVY